MDVLAANPDAGAFYDAIWSGGPSVSALVHGVGFIGQESLLTGDEITAFARRAGITADTTVLDIGSGRGGPACHLARVFGCRVLGIDLSRVGHAQAEARTRADGLGDKVEFRLGDIHAVDLPSTAFDVVIGFDAWCHIPRRRALLQRCADLLRPGGRVAFYDHVERRPHPDEERRTFHALWRFAGLETPASYLEAVEAAGLKIRFREETSVHAARFYTGVVEVYVAERAQFESLVGPDRYTERLERLRLIQRLAASGVLGQLACIAEKPRG